MKHWERIAKEEAAERRELKSLRSYTNKISSSDHLRQATDGQLRAVAAFKNHEGEIGIAAMFAQAELDRRARRGQ